MGQPKPGAEDDLALAEIALSLAEDIFRAELATADTIDLKAAGLAAADVAALAIVVTFHRSVSQWWLGTVLLAAAGMCFFLVLRQRKWELGTEPRDFWETNASRARLGMLESVLASTERNRKHNEPFLQSKGFWFLWGYRTLAAGLVALLATTSWHAYS